MISGRPVRVAWFILIIAAALPIAAQNEAVSPNDPTPTVVLNGDPPPIEVGYWEVVTPRPNGAAIGHILGMQTVHTTLLPSGKILMASGSSWRNRGPIPYFPEFDPPPAPRGVFQDSNDPFNDAKKDEYFQLVNNVSIYDPDDDTFFRIPHPVPVSDPHAKDHFAPNDLFCTGQHHLPNGDVMFAGGTGLYYPFRTGQSSTFIFDWKKELTFDWEKTDWRQMPKDEAPTPWVFSGFMKRGRWYPTLVPLLDGRFVLFAGYVGYGDKNEKGEPYPPMYQFELNSWVEFFDPKAFSSSAPEKAWKAIDVVDHANSPFTTVINPGFPRGDCQQNETQERCVYANQRDNFKLYPNNYLMPDGRIFMTREGDWVSLRTENTAFMRRTKHTYWVSVSGNRNAPEVKFERGPDRPEDVTSYGTSYPDPNTGQLVILGGQPISAGTLFPFNSGLKPYELPRTPYQFAGGRGSRKREIFTPSATAPGGGTWRLEPNFLGTAPQDDRTMHYALILPTREILVINGGNYDFYGPVHYPLLMTPRFEGGKFVRYDTKRMSEGMQARLYHNVALLMPDARVFVAGGNTSRATVYWRPTPPPQRTFPTGQPKPDLSLVDVDMYFYGDGPMGRFEKGSLQVPTETWTAEIFAPPYLFIDPGRRASITSIEPLRPVPYTTKATLEDKTYYLVHGGDWFNVKLAGLPTTCDAVNGFLSLIKLPAPSHGWDTGQRMVPLTFRGNGPGQIAFQVPTAKAANAPPAFYMLFYTDCRGKPTVAQMVRFDDSAKSPLE